MFELQALANFREGIAARAILHCPTGDCLQSPKLGDAVANPFKSYKFPDADEDQRARLHVIMAPYRFRRDEVRQPQHPGTSPPPADRGGRNPVQVCDVACHSGAGCGA